MTALREEAAAIRRNLEELAADRAVGLIDRAQMLAATGRANVRLGEIGAELDSAARENVLAPLVAAENAAAVWEDLDLAVKRAVIKTLMTITLRSPGRGNRIFDPATVQVDWRQPEQPAYAGRSQRPDPVITSNNGLSATRGPELAPIANTRVMSRQWRRWSRGRPYLGTRESIFRA